MKVLRNQKGQGMTEYILITALVIIVAIAAFRIFKPAVKQSFQDTGAAIQKQGSDANIESQKGIGN